jgi:hypothetical protein
LAELLSARHVAAEDCRFSSRTGRGTDAHLEETRGVQSIWLSHFELGATHFVGSRVPA